MAAFAPPVLRPTLGMSASTSSLPTAGRSASIQRRSTLKRSIDDSSILSVPSSPSKRSRVTFDPDIEIVSADDEDDLDPLLVREEVRRAIQRHFAGDDEDYERVKAVFNDSPGKSRRSSTNAIKAHLQAALVHVSSLDKRCNGLVSAIMSTEWVGRDENFIKIYTKFLGNLAASQSGYLHRILFSLVDLLGPQKTRRLSDCRIVRQPAIQKRVLNAIQYLTKLIPLASGTLAQIISKKLQYDFAKPEERVIYNRNFLDLIEFIPELKSHILEGITCELVKLDITVQDDLDDVDDELAEELLKAVSSSQTLVAEASQLSLKSAKQEADEDEDGDDISTSDESDEEDEDSLDPEALRRKKTRDAVRQVDALMDMLFAFYNKSATSSALEVRDRTIQELTQHFDNIILPSYRSRHSQFLIFHFAQISPVTVDGFVTSCISTLLDKNQPPIVRQSAAAYMAGFVGRGAHVSPTVVRDCYSLLCDEVDDLREQFDPACHGPDLKRYNTFYAMFQALMYIFCFRWRDLAIPVSDDDDEDSADEAEMEYHFPDSIRRTIIGAVHSNLNPLRVCTPGIVEQFAKITHALNFIYLFSKIASNKNVRLYFTRVTNDNMAINSAERDLSWVGEDGMMEGYFPYDPYQLPLSKKWVEGDYVQWQGIPGEKVEESDVEEDFEELTAEDHQDDVKSLDEDSA